MKAFRRETTGLPPAEVEQQEFRLLVRLFEKGAKREAQYVLAEFQWKFGDSKLLKTRPDIVAWVTKPAITPESLPIAECFREPAADRLRVIIGGDFTSARGEYFVSKGTRLKKLVSGANTIDSPFRAELALSRIALIRGSKRILPWTKIQDVSAVPDLLLEDGDILLVMPNNICP